jgi:hypothetical protein
VNDPFEKKVRAAAVAGWWVILIGYALLTVTWVAYLIIVSTRPAWMLAMWGQDVSWDFMQVVSLWFLGVLKLFIWILVLIALWLTLWARQVRKMYRHRPRPPRPDVPREAGRVPIGAARRRRPQFVYRAPRPAGGI